jgi:hypothetical protein
MSESIIPPMTHVDDFIDSFEFNEPESVVYAKWLFNQFRLPATLKMKFDIILDHFPLFAVYEDEIYRVTGASRMGDVWLAIDFNRTTGYDKRVLVSQITEWSNTPTGPYNPELLPAVKSHFNNGNRKLVKT